MKLWQKPLILASIALILAPQIGSSQKMPKEHLLATHTMSLDKRYVDPFVNSVFSDNILLTLAYLGNQARQNEPVNWQKTRQFSHFEFALSQGQTFAFHDTELPLYQGKIATTTHAHFNSQEGFESDGYLVGDGVCHLASLLYWTAKDAGLETSAPTNHDFANIPEVPREYGVSIFARQGVPGAMQNLYITNNQNKPIIFKFDFDGHNLKITAEDELNK